MLRQVVYRSPEDSGPQKEVDALRLQMSGPLVPYVVVRGNYAIGQWYGAGGGQDLFKKKKPRVGVHHRRRRK